MKIDAPKAWDSIENGKLLNLAGPEKGYRGYVPVRIVRESDWRKIMAVMRAAEAWGMDDVGEAVNALRKHLAKK